MAINTKEQLRAIVKQSMLQSLLLWALRGVQGTLSWWQSQG